jgi:hypothetical protein
VTDGKPSAKDWKQLYQAAILESDPQIAARLTEEAEKAIVERALVLHRDASSANSSELTSLAYSANFLAELRRVEVDSAKNQTLSPAKDRTSFAQTPLSNA